MGDKAYEEEYLERKRRLREMHKKLKNSKEVQEVYHKIMKDSDSGDDDFVDDIDK